MKSTVFSKVEHTIFRTLMRTLDLALRLARKLMSKQDYFDLCMRLANRFDHVGRSTMLMALCYAVDNQLEITRPSEIDMGDEKLMPAASPAEMPKVKPPVKVAARVAPPPERPSFRAENGEVIPPCFDDLPDYVVFEAMYNKKYGRNGKCPMMIMGKHHQFSCRELYDLMTTIAENPEPSIGEQALYGTVMSVVVMGFGSKIDQKSLN